MARKKAVQKALGQWSNKTWQLNYQRAAKGTKANRARKGTRNNCVFSKQGGLKKFLVGPGGVVYRPHRKGFNKDGTRRQGPTMAQAAWRQKFAAQYAGKKGTFSGQPNWGRYPAAYPRSGAAYRQMTQQYAMENLSGPGEINMDKRKNISTKATSTTKKRRQATNKQDDADYVGY